MTDPKMWDPAENAAYYRTNEGYEDNKKRLSEPRVQWAADRAKHAHKVLDIGCNDGYMTELLPTNIDYTGWELNILAVKNAYPRAQGKIHIVDATKEPIHPATYDCIIAMEILEHIIDPHALLLKLHDALKIDGILITTSAAGHTQIHEPRNNDHLREWNPQEFQELHERAGFYPQEVCLKEVYPGRVTNCILSTRIDPRIIYDGSK